MASVLVLVVVIFIQNCIGQKPPTITYITQNQIKDIGETVKLGCAVKDVGVYAVIWRKSDPTINENNITLSIGSSIVLSGNKFSVRYDKSTSTYTLQIQDIEASDIGTYYCEVPNFPQVSASVELQVRRPPIILNNSTKSIVAVEGQDVQLECYADGYPTPTITWRRQDKKIFRTGGAIYQGNVLSIESIRKEERGTYYCVADNKVGRGTKRNVDLVLEFTPVVTVPFSMKSQALGFDVNLACHIEAYPPPAITWLKNGVPLSFNTQRHTISHFSTSDDVTDTALRIKSTERKQYGKYVCKAANKLGIDEGNVEFLESSKPQCISFCDEETTTSDS